MVTVPIDIGGTRYWTPRPNYLSHGVDVDGPVVQDWAQSQPPPSKQENAAYYSQIMRAAQEYRVVRPKGYTVSYHTSPEMEHHHFGQCHPMKPWRLTLTKSLVTAYGMPFAMDTYHARAATYEELQAFHSNEYLEYLSSAPPEDRPLDDMENPEKEVQVRFNLGGSDCPLFYGLYDFCSMSAGGSLDAARKICHDQSDIAISWGGGLHHAKKAEASGFCYINDIVLAILTLLRRFPRVLYIDIDVHHGDGVEEAFFSTDRVMTASFHKYQQDYFFPGTGALEDNGPKSEHNPGAHHAINVPLNDGITNEQYEALFKSVIGRINSVFRPSAIALQCGADSLAGDRLGRFNLQVQGHGACVQYCKSLGLPMILFGGGGYTPRNVARAWTYETAIAIGCQDSISSVIPEHAPWRDHFSYDGQLFPTLEQILGEPRANKNTQKRLSEIVQHVHEQLRFVSHAPSVQFSAIPTGLDKVRDEVEARLKEDSLEDERLRKAGEEGVGVAGEV